MSAEGWTPADVDRYFRPTRHVVRTEVGKDSEGEFFICTFHRDGTQAVLLKRFPDPESALAVIKSRWPWCVAEMLDEGVRE